MKKFYTTPSITVIAAEPGCILAGSETTKPQFFNDATRLYGGTGDAFSEKPLGTGKATGTSTFTNGSGGGGGNRAKSGSLWDDWE